MVVYPDEHKLTLISKINEKKSTQKNIPNKSEGLKFELIEVKSHVMVETN